MNKGLKQIECDPKCGFLLRSYDEGELLSFTREHGRKNHKMELTDEQIRGMFVPGK
jgi:predicted small metal-binding protein